LHEFDFVLTYDISFTLRRLPEQDQICLTVYPLFMENTMSLTDLMKERLKNVLDAERIAIIGATQHEHPVGMGPICNLLSSSYRGTVFPVNPKYDQILGHKCHANLESIQPPPDLVIILLNQHLALEMTERAGRHGVQAVTIITGGFRETGADGTLMEEKLRAIAYRYDLPVIGPNTLGFSNFHRGMHGIFWHLKASPGHVAVVAQSGGVGLSIANSLKNLECGLSHFIGAGNCSIVQIADYLHALKDNPLVKCFCVFMEGLVNPREFYETARTITHEKPIVVYKAGKREEVCSATVTHTGSLTGEYALYQAMFRQAGVLEADSSWEAAVVSKAMCLLPPVSGNRLCVLTYTAGPAIVAMDRLVEAGWELSPIRKDVMIRIQSIIGDNTPVILQNPVDLTGPGFVPNTYARVLKQLLQESFDAYLLIWSYNPVVRIPVAEIEAFSREFAKPIVLALLASEVEISPCLQDIHSRGICAYMTPEDAAVALNALLGRHRFLTREKERPGEID